MGSVSDSDSHDSHDVPEQEEQWDDWEEEEGSGVRCLLSAAVFPTVDAALAQDALDGFDLRKYMKQERLGQYEVIKVINFFRSEVQAGRDPLSAVLGGGRPWDNDKYFQPVLPDDELLFHDWEEEADEKDGPGSHLAHSSQRAAASTGLEGSDLAQLLRENEALRSALEAMQAVMLQDEGGSGLAELQGQQQQEEEEEEAKPSSSATASRGIDGAGPSSEAAAAIAEAGGGQAERIDKSYFESYSFFDIHREMLGDKVRTDAYQAALEGNPSLMRGATVLDVGCGTAILSMFAARAGAAAVIGVDGSEEIAKYARANCLANGLSSEAGQGGPVTIVMGRVEALEELPLPDQAGRVDVLVSEWMGYALLFESMLDSVLAARDRFLKPGGALLPDLAHIYLAAGGQDSTGLAFWTSVYGFTMAPVQDSIRQSALRRAVVRPVTGEQLVSPAVCIKRLDLANMTADDQDFTAEFRLEARPGGGPQPCHSLVLWFDTVFSERFCREQPVTLGTSPDEPQTHWAQTVLLLREPIQLASADTAAAEGASGGSNAVALTGRISFARNKARHRSLDIAVQYRAVYRDGSRGPEEAAIYAMGVGDS